MSKLPKDKRDKLMIVVISTCAVVAGFYLLVIGGQQTSLQEFRQKSDATQEKLQKAELWLRMAPSIQAKLNAARKELEGKQRDMTPLDKFKWFYNTLDRFLAQHRVKLVDITREPELGPIGVLPKFPYQAATFGVKLVAHYHDLGSFLAEFENHFPYMRVQNLDLEADLSKVSPREGAPADQPSADAEAIAITMRVVTLIKPADTL